MIGLYKFNSCSWDILYDYSGNHNHGVINGAQWFGVKPEILSIEDVPNDQGGWASLSFNRSLAELNDFAEDISRVWRENGFNGNIHNVFGYIDKKLVK